MLSFTCWGIFTTFQSSEIIECFSQNDYAFNLLNKLINSLNYKNKAMVDFYDQYINYLNSLAWDNESVISNLINASRNEDDNYAPDNELDTNTESDEVILEVEDPEIIDRETLNNLAELKADYEKDCFAEIKESICERLMPIIKINPIIVNYSDVASFTANITSILGRPLKDCEVEFYIYGHTDSYPSWLEEFDFLSKILGYLWFFMYFYGDIERYRTCDCIFCRLLNFIFPKF